MPVILDGAQCLRPLDTTTIQFGATATTATGALKSRLVRLNTTAAVCVAFDGGVAATATSVRLAADQTEYFQVATAFILGAVAADSTAGGIIGTLYVTECG